MKQYFFTNEDPHSKSWSVSILHATPFRTEKDAEKAINKYQLTDAVGCQEFNDHWYVYRESKNSLG
jgi:hypothetical protein